MAQVLLSRNAELAVAERKLEALQSDVQAARAQGVRDLEAAERRHRAEVAREAAEREKLKRRELQLEVKRGLLGEGGQGGLPIPVWCWCGLEG